ncbi:MAG: hypothetical protein F4110_05350 [Acidimicrobiaceae bacterium]|nr:hypothetical protein [Acidimicrobiaceae bacterium]MYE97539.1 hypothetical protein [Acidimicrobiaceae bacterium]MYI53395.1 hypothetical protein [Acidimicrobiaceae bacterium]
MLRIRAVGTLVLAVVLAAAACGDTSTTGTVDVPATTTGAEAEPATTTSGAPEESADSTGAAAGSEADAAAGEASGDPDETAPTDAAALLASATELLDGRPVRGEATIELAPGFGFSTSFESDADGDLDALAELPPGMDPEFPAGADAGIRYVGGVVYLRPLTAADDLEELGVDEAWFVAEPASTGDPMAQAMGPAGVMCVFLQTLEEVPEECDPLGDAGAFLEAAREPEVVGREDVRGVEANRVRFLVSLMDLAGEALGMETGADDGEVGAFDDTASDPFAEGLEQIFGFLDADFEVEVWIDDDSLIRRLTFDIASLFAGIAGGEAAAEMPSSLLTLEFYDFDADIGVDAPPSEAIFDRSLLLGDDDHATSEDFEPYYDEYDDG